MISSIIYWNVDPTIINITDTLPLKYYGLLWAIGLMSAFVVVKRIYEKEGIPIENLENLSVYVFLGAFLGARLGHCLFYEPIYYLHHPLEILLPITFVNGSVKFIGFQGLASHGGTLGIMIAIIIYGKKTKTNILWILDRVAIASAITAMFIRIGNLMNSEIYGKPTNGDWGVVFQRDDMIPRHPTQVYEAFSYLVIFIILSLVYNSKKIKKHNGLIVGLLFVLLFTARFIIEFFKENQEHFEDTMALNMGQILSIPFIIAGLVLIFWKKKIPNN